MLAEWLPETDPSNDGPWRRGMVWEGVGFITDEDDGNVVYKNGGLAAYMHALVLMMSLGGHVVAYDETRVRVWVPDANNGHNRGSIVFVGDGTTTSHVTFFSY